LAGALTRLISFAADPAVPDPWYLASAAPVSELAATGAQLIPPALAGAIVIGLALSFTEDVLDFARSFSSGSVFTYAWVPTLLIILVVLGLTLWPFPNPTLAVVAGFAAGLSSRWLSGRTTGLVRALVPVIILYAGVTLGGGLAQDPAAADVRFAAESELPNARYTRMGAADGLVFLRTCDQPPRILGVRQDVVVSMSVVRNEQPERASVAQRYVIPSFLEWFRPWMPVSTDLFNPPADLQAGPRYQCGES
jgi:hypothetical protein